MYMYMYIQMYMYTAAILLCHPFFFEVRFFLVPKNDECHFRMNGSVVCDMEVYGNILHSL